MMEEEEEERESDGETPAARPPDGDRSVSREGDPDEAGEEREEESVQEPKSYGTILEEEIWQGLSELRRPARGLVLSGLSAGLDIGFTLFLMGVLLTVLGGDTGDPTVRIALGLTYPVGFVFVLLGRSELFTEHTTLAVFPVLGGRAGLGRLARLWGLVYSSNLVGAAVFAALAALIGPAMGTISENSLREIARGLLDHSDAVMFASAVLAGWMMGLLSWLLAAARETISRIFVVWLVTAGIGIGELHHCIVGTVEVLAGAFVDPSIGAADFGRFLLWSTLGNAVGGVVFVALIKYSHAVEGPFIPLLPPHGE